MELFMPSEVARLIYGYLKQERNEDTAESFLKSSPHLTECYQMFKANRQFNVKVNGFHLNEIFDIFGTMSNMINERVPETCESKSLIEKLQYLLDVKHMPIKQDKCVETELNMVDKCVGCIVYTENKSTHTAINTEDNKIATEVLEIPSFSDIIPCNISKTKEIDTMNETITTVETNSKICASPCLSSTSQVYINNNVNIPNFSEVEEKESPVFQINKQTCSTPTKKNEGIRINGSPRQNFIPKNIPNQFFNQLQYQPIPEATALESMPGLSKEDRIKDNSVIIDTGELVDTFLSDKSLLEKIADTINKSIDIQKETNSDHEGKVLDPPSLEKALYSTQSEPQIKNILDEFLVFNVDHPEENKNSCSDVQTSIKSRLRSAKKNDDIPGKIIKNCIHIPKQSNFSNEDCMSKTSDSHIVLIHEGNTISNNIRSSIFEDYNLSSNQIVLQPNDSNAEQTINVDITEIIVQDDYTPKAKYVKIAPKISSVIKTHQVPEKRIFPKRKRRSLEQFGIRSKFRKSKINSMQLPETTQSPKSIVIEVPNQNSFETQEINNIRFTEVSKVKNITQDTPDDRLKPPKNKSMSTPRRRSTHIRCLDFSTPQPKNNSRDQARSKLFCDSPKICEKILEEPLPSPLPKLQADWGSVNGFDSIIKKDNNRHWDTDIREMVGAGILTSDADGRKTRKKKTPRKKIKPASDKNNSELVIEEQTNSNQTNELTDETNQTNVSEKSCNLNDQSSSRQLCNDQMSLNEPSEYPISLEISNKVAEMCSEQPPVESNSLKSFNDLKSLIKPTEFPISLETSDKVTELYNETPSVLSDSLTNLNDSKLLKQQSNITITLETPDKVTELNSEQPSIISNSLKNLNDPESLQHPSKFTLSLETPDKVTELYSEQPSIISNSLKNLNDPESLKHPSKFTLSLETPDKVTELYSEQPSTISDSFKSCKDPKSLAKISEFPVSLETPNKFVEFRNKSLLIESNPLKNVCKTQNNLEQISTNLNTLENNLSQSNCAADANTCTTSSISITLSEITEQHDEKGSSFSETIKINNNLKPLSFKLPENKKNESIENFVKHDLRNQIKTNNSNSPVKLINIQSNKQNQIETPYKCDDSAVDIPETPISKLIREYDPSKLVTPLPCTPEHCEDSLTETPLTKVFRETLYLNRPPISPFPPTPGNSRSIDTLIVPLEQENSKMSNSTNSKINGMKVFLTQPFQTTTINTESSTTTKKCKVKSTPLKAKQKLSTKSKTKNGLKRKSDVDAKKKQVYESVKAELFGNLITSSSSADELDKTNEHKTIVIKKKTIEKEKTSGFKPIPKRKSIQSTYVAVNGIENCSLTESNLKVTTKLPLTKPTIVQNKEITSEKNEKTSLNKQFNKSKKSMVHFDDPIEQFFNLPSKKTPFKTKNEIQNMGIEKPEQLIGLSRYLNKSSTFYECNPIKKTKIKNNELGTKTSKLNNSDSSINYSEIYSIDKTKLPSFFNNKTQTHSMYHQMNKSADHCTLDEKKNSAVLDETNVPLNSMKSRELKLENFTSQKEENNKTFDILELPTLSYSNSIKNTSCVTVGHNDELEIHLKKVNDPINNIEYLKKPKVYEVITEDGEHGMVYLKLSESFNFLNIPSELHNVPKPNLIPSPLKTHIQPDVSQEMEAGELKSDSIMSMPVTSTPKDIENKNDHKHNRGRRSPSFWEDSVHNYSTKKSNDRHRESNRRMSKSHHDNRYDKNKWSIKPRYNNDRHQFDNRNRSQRNQGNVKREFSDHLMRDKERLKYRDDKRRSYRDFSNYDDRKVRDRLEESEQFSTTQRKSQNDSQKQNRAENIIKKATKRPLDRGDYKIPPKVSKVEHQRLLKNVDVDEFLCVVHGQK